MKKGNRGMVALHLSYNNREMDFGMCCLYYFSSFSRLHIEMFTFIDVNIY